ncbi:MAG TPA: glycosyltransferase [Candidatus Eremiobacteraceae bacterium]|jgi:hypothetical protein
MPRNEIVAHLIIGRRREPYLAAVLESIADACAVAVINDNGGSIPGANDDFLQSSRLGKDGRLIIIRTPFDGFASARNACIDATPAELRGVWTLFVDADEVHGGELAAMARLLPSLPVDVDAVEGYSRHFVGSFSWWVSVERRLCFFRGRDDRRWFGRVHERLEPLGRRVILPFVWAHYGHVVTPRMEWEKSRLYSSLGQPGFAPTDEELASVDAAQAWGRFRTDVMRFDGQHPPAARPIVDALRIEWAPTLAAVDVMFSQVTPFERLRRGVRRANYARLIALRKLEAGARWGRIA